MVNLLTCSAFFLNHFTLYTKPFKVTEKKTTFMYSCKGTFSTKTYCFFLLFFFLIPAQKINVVGTH